MRSLLAITVLCLSFRSMAAHRIANSSRALFTSSADYLPTDSSLDFLSSTNFLPYERFLDCYALDCFLPGKYLLRDHPPDDHFLVVAVVISLMVATIVMMVVVSFLLWMPILVNLLLRLCWKMVVQIYLWASKATICSLSPSVWGIVWTIDSSWWTWLLNLVFTIAYFNFLRTNSRFHRRRQIVKTVFSLANSKVSS